MKRFALLGLFTVAGLAFSASTASAQVYVTPGPNPYTGLGVSSSLYSPVVTPIGGFYTTPTFRTYNNYGYRGGYYGGYRGGYVGGYRGGYVGGYRGGYVGGYRGGWRR